MKSIPIKFDITDKVFIDGDTSIVGIVVGINVYPSGVTYKVGWFNGGESMFDDFDEFRLEETK